VRDLAYVKRLVADSAYPQAEIHITEWNSSPSSRDFMHDALPAATFVVRANIEATGLVDSLSYWTFTDIFEEEGSGDGVFHGGFGLINFQGIVKPTFHAYRFLHLLGDEEILRARGCLVTRHTNNGQISMLLYHYPDELTTVVPIARRYEDTWEIQRLGEPWQVKLEVADLVPGTVFVIETLDQCNGNVLTAWEKMGQPTYPTREQTRVLQEFAWNTRKEVVKVDEQGCLRMTACLQPWSLVSLRAAGIAGGK
jgi:xylan 1,4-beta-xylosidase